MQTNYVYRTIAKRYKVNNLTISLVYSMIALRYAASLAFSSSILAALFGARGRKTRVVDGTPFILPPLPLSSGETDGERLSSLLLFFELVALVVLGIAFPFITCISLVPFVFFTRDPLRGDRDAEPLLVNGSPKSS